MILKACMIDSCFVAFYHMIVSDLLLRTSDGDKYSRKNKMAENGVRSEDVLGQKWDRCVSDTAIKCGNIFSTIPK